MPTDELVPIPLKEEFPSVHALWEQHANCAQSTGAGLLKIFGYSLESTILFDSFYPFGGGFKEGDLCGVISGSLAALSYILTKENVSKTILLTICDQFKTYMTNQFDSLVCKDLLAPFEKLDQPDDEVAQLRRHHCTFLVYSAVSHARDLLNSQLRSQSH